MSAEVGARVLAYSDERMILADWDTVLEQRARAVEGSDADLGSIIYPSDHQDIIYRLLPDLEVRYIDQPFSTNSDGWRGPLVPKEKGDGVFRVVGLGDSVMMGHGVADGDEYLQVMRRELERAGLPVCVEVVNLAVSGYNTTMEVATLEQIGLQWQPDLVMLDFVRNDYTLPNFIIQESDFLALDRSWFLEWVRSVVGSEGPACGFGQLKNAPPDEKGGFVGDMQRTPPKYRHQVGRAGFRRAMARLAELQREHGFAVVVTMHRYGDPVVEATCREHGFPFVCAEEVTRQYMQRHGIDRYEGSQLTVSGGDPHPSTLQHRLLGRYYADWIGKSGLIEARAHRSPSRTR